jgi:uncharacterized protein
MRLVRIQRKHVAKELVVKIHGWCNLACTYCYEYTGPDQSWRKKPKMMSRETMDRLATRVAEYMREHRLASLQIIIHGGEPLLAGIDNVVYLVTTLRAAVPGRTLHFNIQTNGTLLTPAILDMCLEQSITIGISLDGNEAANAQRPFHNGRSSHGHVAAALELFKDARYKPLLKGILCVINLRNDPVATYEYLLTFGAPSINFLLPLANWTNLPPLSYQATGVAHYAEWLLKLLIRWARTPREVSIPFFEQIIDLLLMEACGEEFPHALGIEALGPWVVGAIVIATDGSYELLDGYKTTKAGEVNTGLNVRDHTLTRALVEVLETTQERGIVMGAPECQECELYKICGGDLYLHRYGSNGYANISVYCVDLTALIMAMKAWLSRSLPEYVALYKSQQAEKAVQ